MTHGNSKPRPHIDEIRRLYHDEGLTQRQVAMRLNVSYSTIKRWFIDMGIECRPSGWTTHQRTNAIQARREKPKTETIMSPPPPPSPPTPTDRPFLQLDADDQDLIRWHVQQLKRRAAVLRRT